MIVQLVVELPVEHKVTPELEMKDILREGETKQKPKILLQTYFAN